MKCVNSFGRTYVLIVHGVREVLGGGVCRFLRLLIHGVHAALEWHLAVRGGITTITTAVSMS
jgi:hypothetical protein